MVFLIHIECLLINKFCRPWTVKYISCLPEETINCVSCIWRDRTVALILLEEATMLFWCKPCDPVWSSGSDTWLSPRRPGFDSRYRKVILLIFYLCVFFALLFSLLLSLILRLYYIFLTGGCLWGFTLRKTASNFKRFYMYFIVVLKSCNLYLFLRLYTNEIALKST